ncbi:MAG: ABC transporter permease [Chloroflexota bacterium]|jgi:ABC-2 type transport system permease protein
MKTNLAQAIWVETLKFRLSRMPLLSLLGFLLVPLIGGFFMIILKDPEFARRVGLISAKAQLLAGTADWPTFLNLMAQAVAIGGIILFGFIGSWVFGREYSDRVVKDLLALPTSRSTIVLAKFVVVIGWSVIVTIVIYVSGLGVGAAVGLPPVPSGVFWHSTLTVSISAVLTISLVTPIAFFASAGHGYLPPLAAAVLAILLAQIIAVAGYGEYFPWAIPALYSQGSPIGPTSYLIVFMTGILGITGTFLWWELADQTH